MLDCALIGEIHANAYDTRKPLRLLGTAKRLRINTEEVRKTLKPEQTAKKETRGKDVIVSDRPKSTIAHA